MVSQLKSFESLVVNLITIFMLIPSIKKFVSSKTKFGSQSPYWVSEVWVICNLAVTRRDYNSYTTVGHQENTTSP